MILRILYLLGWLKFLGLFNTRMLPELAPWNSILGRITIVSAYVLEGNKERMTANFDGML
jgi:hypothetical protein